MVAIREHGRFRAVVFGLCAAGAVLGGMIAEPAACADAPAPGATPAAGKPAQSTPPAAPNNRKTDLPVPATYSEVAYGPEQRQVLWFWKAESQKPAPLLVIIHGGGWLHGDGYSAVCNEYRVLVPKMLKNGISVASISYRYSTVAPLPAPVYDAARAVQFLRSKATEWNIDKTRVAATGGSAGGCSTLWLATHDDLADPKAQDPVLRESTRLCGALAGAPQTTIDPVQIREIGNEEALKHSMINKACGFRDNKDMDANYARAEAMYKEFSPVTHLTREDPPILLEYYADPNSSNDGIHHPKFGIFFKKKADEIGATCYLRLRKAPDLYPGAPDADTFLYQILGVSNPAK